MDGDAWGYVVLLLIIIAVIAAFVIGGPIYGVWSAGKAGEAALAQATYDRQVAVVEAEALNASAGYKAQAEITQAYGVAKANQIIGQSLENNQAYLDYLWVNNLANTQNQVIYVPTESNLPILEAGRLKANSS